MQVMIDREGCIGCGLCTETCPAVFRMAGDGRAEVCGQPDEETAASVQEAADNSPVAVIAVE